jgi:hypothetical protein
MRSNRLESISSPYPHDFTCSIHAGSTLGTWKGENVLQEFRSFHRNTKYHAGSPALLFSTGLDGRYNHMRISARAVYPERRGRECGSKDICNRNKCHMFRPPVYRYGEFRDFQDLINRLMVCLSGEAMSLRRATNVCTLSICERPQYIPCRSCSLHRWCGHIATHVYASCCIFVKLLFSLLFRPFSRPVLAEWVMANLRHLYLAVASGFFAKVYFLGTMDASFHSQ